MILFEWDEAKAQSNLRKHGVSFDLAVQVFDDQHIIAEQDRIVHGEPVGRASGWPLALRCWWLDIQYADKVRMKLSASSRRERRLGRSGSDMGKIVRKTLVEAKAALAGQTDELKKLKKMPDSGIDFSDLPELTEKFWQNAVPNPFYRPIKKQVTLRIDADILAWLRQQGKQGYQSRLNALLRGIMLRDLATKRKRA